MKVAWLGEYPEIEGHTPWDNLEDPGVQSNLPPPGQMMADPDPYWVLMCISHPKGICRRKFLWGWSRGTGYSAGFAHNLCGNLVHGHEKAGKLVGPEGTGSTVEKLHPDRSHERGKRKSRGERKSGVEGGRGYAQRLGCHQTFLKALQP